MASCYGIGITLKADRGCMCIFDIKPNSPAAIPEVPQPASLVV